MLKAGLLCITLVIFSLSSCSRRSDDEATDAPKETVPVADLIKQADEMYRQRDNPDKLREGLTLLKRARSSEPENYEANWKFSRLCYYLGDGTSDEKEAEKVFKDGIDAGKVAVRIAPDKPDGYFWQGANLGGSAEKHPFTEGIKSVGEIRNLMNKVIEIQPNYEGASAYGVLAQVELGTRLMGGSAEKAREYLEKAIALEPNNSNTRLHLAETYLSLNRKEDAKKQLDYILKMTPDADHLPDHNQTVEEAKKMLQTKF